MADAERFDLSVPEILDKLFEGATIKVPLIIFQKDQQVYNAFLNNMRTAKSRMTKKFRALGMEFEQDQTVLSMSVDPTEDVLVMKLVPPKRVAYHVIVEMPESFEG